MDSRSNLVLLGLFPELNIIGGVQASGRIAWDGLTKSLNQEPSRAFLFCYDNTSNHLNGSSFASIVKVRTKLNAAFGALKTPWSPHQVLIWHLGLLKLLPFFRLRDANVTLFLHGIECWKRLDVINRALLRRVKLFLSNSEFTWQRFVQCNPEFGLSEHKLVHLGIGSPLAASTPPPGVVPIALMISRLVRSEDYKGHREMIQAWPLVMQQIPEAKLWIVGDGDLKPELEKIILALGLVENIHLWGELSEEKKQDMLASARCLALPSRGEGFGLVYLEAMRLGRPCLVSTIDAGREVINPPEAGLAVNLDDARQIADAVCALLTPDARWMAWSTQAKQRYNMHFTAARFQQRLCNALYLDSTNTLTLPD